MTMVSLCRPTSPFDRHRRQRLPILRWLIHPQHSPPGTGTRV